MRRTSLSLLQMSPLSRCTKWMILKIVSAILSKNTIVHLHDISPPKWLAAWPVRGPQKFTSLSRPPIVQVGPEKHTQTDVNLPEHVVVPTNQRRGAGFCCVSAQWYNLCTNFTYLYYDGHQGQAFWDICDDSAPLLPLQIYSARDLEDNLNKIREICSDDKHDWDQRANAVSRFTLNAWNFSVSSALIVAMVFFCPPIITSTAEEDSLTLSCRCSHLRLFLPAFTTPGWSLQIIS